MSSPLKIQFVGKKLGKKPSKTINDGNDTIILPTNQTKAFTHEKARVILAHAPHLYKKVVKKVIKKVKK